MKKYVVILMSFLLLGTGTLSYASEVDLLQYAASPKAEVAFYYENLVTGDKLMYNENKIFPAASTIKLPLVVYVYQLAAQEKLNLDQKMTYTSGFYYEGTGVIRYEKVGSQYTLRDLVKKSLVHSDNIAYSMLKAKVGAGNFVKYLKSLGGTVVSSHGIKSMNCIDYSLYIKDFYNFTKAYPELGKELMDYAVHTDFNDHIPAGLSGIEVAHKIGWLPRQNLYHDGGIVYDEQPYILIIFSKGLSDQKQREYFKTLTSKVQEYHMTNRMVPLRDWVKAQNGQINWNSDTQMVSAIYTDMEIIIDEIEQKLWINGAEMPYKCKEYKDTMYIAPELLEMK